MNQPDESSYRGSGQGRFRRLNRVKDINELNAGDLIICVSHSFCAVNVARITGPGVTPDTRLAIFVDPADPSRKRAPTDQEFCIHAFDLGFQWNASPTSGL